MTKTFEQWILRIFSYCIANCEGEELFGCLDALENACKIYENENLSRRNHR